MSKPTTFNNVAEAISAANYIQQLLAAEYQWVSNRLSWLFISQSFCISAYVILQTSTAERFAGSSNISILTRGLPVFGVICSVTIGVAVFAAAHVMRSLFAERCRIIHYINENSPLTIPLAGAEGDLREKHWVRWVGSIPHYTLPWVLGLLWFALIFRSK
jgi:hypothetical protein